MTKVQFARIREQGITFGVVVVKDSAVNDVSNRNGTVAYWSRSLGCPTVIIGANHHQCYGRNDLVRFMASVPIQAIPWQTGTIAD